MKQYKILVYNSIGHVIENSTLFSDSFSAVKTVAVKHFKNTYGGKIGYMFDVVPVKKKSRRKNPCGTRRRR
jgi:hypothetical protein